ncbi:chromosomal replication initiator protein DnaA [Magnetococcales bacterium HHB-1]
MDDLWKNVLEVVRDQVSAQVFESSLEPLKVSKREPDSDKMEILVWNNFVLQWVRSRYHTILEEAAASEMGRPVEVTYRIDASAFPDLGKKVEKKVEVEAVEPTEEEKIQSWQETGLDDRYTFENYVVGGCNQFVNAAAERVAEMPAKAYNPLFIYGGVGLGKSHIIQAIGHRVFKQRTDLKVLYISSERFTTKLIDSIRYNKIHHFKEDFRSVDILIIDDIQFIAGKKATQEEIFHTFNALYESKKQIIMASDQLPSKIEALQERLSSRFSMGLVADISPPDLETRVAILKKKASSEGLELMDDVAFFLAKAVRSNVRELEGALIKVSAYASLTEQSVSLGLVKEALKGQLPELDSLQQKKAFGAEEILKMVSDYYKVPSKDICSKVRTRAVSRPRQICMYLCKTFTDLSYVQIGYHLGKKDHSSVVYAVKQIEKKIKKEAQLREDVEKLSNIIKQKEARHHQLLSL